jgi:hypothetical protein
MGCNSQLRSIAGQKSDEINPFHDESGCNHFVVFELMMLSGESCNK